MRRSHLTTGLFTSIILALFLTPLPGRAQSKFTDFRQRSYSSQDLEKALIPDAASSSMRTRGVEPQKPQQPGAPSVSSAAPSVAPKIAVGLNVLFEYNSDIILPRYYVDLDKLGEVLVRNPQYQFQIEGHTDNTGAEPYNDVLSAKRAESVKRYLLEHFSIPASRLVAKGFGETTPRASNATVAGRSVNRRVEVVNLGQQ